jgi:hypothetical protein
MTLHGTSDLFVPIFLQQTLKRAVVAAGKPRLLTWRIMRIAGHCGFRSGGADARSPSRGVGSRRREPDGDEVLGMPATRA